MSLLQRSACQSTEQFTKSPEIEVWRVIRGSCIPGILFRSRLAMVAFAKPAPAAGTTAMKASTVYNGAIDPSCQDLSQVRQSANLLEGVHSDREHPLTERVLSRVPELAQWDRWYSHPRLCAIGGTVTSRPVP